MGELDWMARRGRSRGRLLSRDGSGASVSARPVSFPLVEGELVMGEVLLSPVRSFSVVTTSVFESVQAHLWWLGLSVLVGAALWGACGVWWRRRARVALGSRTVVDLVPSRGFDPSVEEIGRHVARLARVPAAVGWLPRRASGVRMRHVSVEGRLATRLEGPARAAGLLRLSSFPDVDVLDADRGSGEVRPIRFTNIAPLSVPDDGQES
ncbi:hypothetical protein ACIO8G_35210 [Streptomyces sp. NPDC087219]|uniref:hypothetical protein n=1 Tax=Streptomyces sp. NPDC087219 TaxID=3365770 RepID=UPI0038302C54